MDWKNYILDAPYNTLNLPNGESLNFSNPQEQSKSIKMENNIKTDSKNNFYDATNKMVNDYLKNNQTMYDNIGKYYGETPHCWLYYYQQKRSYPPFGKDYVGQNNLNSIKRLNRTS